MSAMRAVVTILHRFNSPLTGALRVCRRIMDECFLDFQQVRVQLRRGGIALRAIGLAGFKNDGV